MCSLLPFEGFTSLFTHMFLSWLHESQLMYRGLLPPEQHFVCVTILHVGPYRLRYAGERVLRYLSKALPTDILHGIPRYCVIFGMEVS